MGFLPWCLTEEISSALRIVSSLGEAAHSRPSSSRVDYPIQRRLLCQLVTLKLVGAISKEGIDALRRCYGVLEKLLDYETLREPTAELLVLIMQHWHASSPRLTKVKQLLRTAEDPPVSLQRLREKYRSFLFKSPSEISPLKAISPSDEGSDFEQWRLCVVSKYEQAEGSTTVNTERKNKRRKLSHDPVEPFELELVARKIDRPFRKFHSELPSTLSEPGDTIDSVEWSRSNSWKTLLDRGFGQDREYFTTIYNRLSSAVYHYRSWQMLEEGGSNESAREDPTLPILNWLLSICEVSGELPDLLERLLFEHLQQWNGKLYRSETFSLLPYLRPPALDVLNRRILKPLAELAEDADVTWTNDSIRSLTSLMANWVARDDPDVEHGSFTAYGESVDGMSYLAALQGLLEFLDERIESAISRDPRSLDLKLAALDFYEKMLDLPLVHNLPVVVAPSQVFAYSVLFSDELSCISRMAGIIARLREALTGDNTAISVDDSIYTEPVAALNTLLVDFSCPVWKRGFLESSSPEKGNAGMGLSEAQLEQLRTIASKRDQSPTSALGLTTHGALANLAVEFLKTLARREGKDIDYLLGAVSTATLKELNKSASGFRISFTAFRPLFLEHLRDRGANGLYEFLSTTMQSLIQRRETQEAEKKKKEIQDL
ncbi:uncharacterized protein JCM6883_000887 [Sporobolomyces salmoneus]|uniref:uncharacterized protein n=1 Tax=Sporobolomyces salmoneus TaxID=183962 RepID=UPI003180F980